MGLDMNLTKKHSVKNWEHTLPEKKVTVTVEQNGKIMKNIDINRVCYIEEDVCYWRKANQIHKWFVDNTQESDNNGGTSYVTLGQLKELYAICERIIAECPLVDGKVKNGSSFIKGEWVDQMEDGKVMTNVELAQELLPSQDGFFFGGTDYDEYYMQDILHTRDTLKKEIDLNDDRADYYYRASW